MKEYDDIAFHCVGRKGMFVAPRNSNKNIGSAQLAGPGLHLEHIITADSSVTALKPGFFEMKGL
jgi:hypothetical protein